MACLSETLSFSRLSATGALAAAALVLASLHGAGWPSSASLDLGPIEDLGPIGKLQSRSNRSMRLSVWRSVAVATRAERSSCHRDTLGSIAPPGALTFSTQSLPREGARGTVASTAINIPRWVAGGGEGLASVTATCEASPALLTVRAIGPLAGGFVRQPPEPWHQTQPPAPCAIAAATSRQTAPLSWRRLVGMPSDSRPRIAPARASPMPRGSCSPWYR